MMYIKYTICIKYIVIYIIYNTYMMYMICMSYSLLFYSL